MKIEIVEQEVYLDGRPEDGQFSVSLIRHSFNEIEVEFTNEIAHRIRNGNQKMPFTTIAFVFGQTPKEALSRGEALAKFINKTKL